MASEIEDPYSDNGSTTRCKTPRKRTSRSETAKSAKLLKRQQEAAAAAAAATGDIEIHEPFSAEYGYFALKKLRSEEVRPLRSLNAEMKDHSVLIRGLVEKVRVVGVNKAVVVVKERRCSVQCVVTVKKGQVSRNMVKFVAGLSVDSLVVIEGTVSVPRNPVTDASQPVEIQVRKSYCISKSEQTRTCTRKRRTEQDSQPNLQPPTQDSPPTFSPEASRPHSEEGETLKRRRGRGPTLCNDIYTMGPGYFIKVELNSFKQPVGDGAQALSSFLGTIARNGKLLPIDVQEWRKMPKLNRENVWHNIREKFEIGGGGRKWVMKSVSIKWKDWKHVLYKKYHKEGQSEVVFPDDTRVLREQWVNLVAYWNSDTYKKRSATNSKNRRKVKVKHCMGTKSFARVAHEEWKKTGIDIDRVELWIKTHTKDGIPVDDASASFLAQIHEIRSQEQGEGTETDPASKEDILARVLGHERRGRVHGLGLGPTPSDLWDQQPKHVFTSNLVSDNQRLSQELVDMKDKVAQLEEEMRQMKEMLLNRQAPVAEVPSSFSPHKDISSEESRPAPSLEGHAANALLNIAVSAIDPLKHDQDIDKNQYIPCKMLSLHGKVVAKGYLLNEDPAKMVGGSPLGPGWCEVIIERTVAPVAPLMKPHGHMKIIKDAAGTNVAWNRNFIRLTKSKR